MVGPLSWVRRLLSVSPAWSALLAAFLLLASAPGAGAMDIQNVERGKGLKDTLCVDSGIDGIRDSIASGDDTIVTEDIQSGANGICESTPNSLNAGGDDVHPVGITVGQGEAFRAIIRPQPDNICRSAVNLKNDDQLRVPGPGTSTPRQVGVRLYLQQGAGHAGAIGAVHHPPDRNIRRREALRTACRLYQIADGKHCQ